jgi:MoaA/NifB/PqqE/SkfB family radical SAM enzyme
MLFPTNGLLPQRIHDSLERILRHCQNSVVCAKVSVDGLGEDHDRLRQTPGGFAKAMETCRLLSALADRYANFELGINTVFSAGNQDAMDGIIDFIRGLDGVRSHTISLIRGNLADARHKDVDQGKYQRATARLAQGLRDGTAQNYRFRGAGLKAAQDVLQRRLIHRTVRTGEWQIPCYAGRLNLVLSETGELYPCENSDTPFGNVRDHDLDVMRLLRSATSVAAVEELEEKRCHCTHECNFMMNILFDPGTYPALAREYLRLYGAPRLWPVADRPPS